MWSSGDWDKLNAALMQVRGDNSASIVIRRSGVDQAAQTVRIARVGGGQGIGAEAEAAQQSVVVMGDTDFDVEPADRFTHDGGLYEVISIRPNRRAAVVAEARVLE